MQHAFKKKLEVIFSSTAITRNAGVAYIPEQGSPSVTPQSSNSCVVLGSNPSFP